MSRSIVTTQVFVTIFVISAGVSNSQNSEETVSANFVDCYVCNGNYYRGNVNTTVSGRNCQRWDVNEPHKVKKMPRRDLSENYCRNVDGEEKPWCYTTDPQKKREYCNIRRCTNDDGSLYIPELNYTTECSGTIGETYRGTISTTILGKTCANWGSKKPHKQTFTPDKYPCSGLEENYCRNPLSRRDAPWCYTTDQAIKWQYCSIPFCGPDGEAMTIQSQTPVECGESSVQPTFTNQNFEIKDGKIVESLPMSSPRILGGNTVKRGTWPWMIQIKKGRRRRAHCGGTLIHKYWVLTAAHCVGKTPKEYFVAAGKHLLGAEANAQIRSVAQLWIHEDYGKGGGIKNDVALILVKKPFEFTNLVRPACLPEPEYIVPAGTYSIAVGWGGTQDPNWTKELKQAVLTVRNCDKVFFVCTGGKNARENVCPGDSGGPLLNLENNKWVVEGIASHNYGCKEKNNHAGFSRVSKYVDWINQKIEIYTPANPEDAGEA